MKSIAYRLHQLFNEQPRIRFGMDMTTIPRNGIYVMFEEGETLEGMDRIIRVGTHTGDNQLRSRIEQHFIKENKNRSIFRKNLGFSFLNNGREGIKDPSYIDKWELDTTPVEGRDEKLKLINADFEKLLEKEISAYIQNKISFVVFEVPTKEERIKWESKLISTLSNATKSGDIKPSANWFGNHTTKPKIKDSGLWQVLQLFKEDLTEEEFSELVKLVE